MNLRIIFYCTVQIKGIFFTVYVFVNILGYYIFKMISMSIIATIYMADLHRALNLVICHC